MVYLLHGPHDELEGAASGGRGCDVDGADFRSFGLALSMPMAYTRGKTGPSKKKKTSAGPAMPFALRESAKVRVLKMRQPRRTTIKRIRGAMIRQRGAKRKRPTAKVVWPTST